MKSNYTHASIIPLIGGETIAQENIFGSRPEYLLTYSPFLANEKHLLNYYKDEVPYHILDEKKNFKAEYVDVVNTVCPCAGLSMLNTSSSSDAPANDWMYESANYVLNTIKPQVFWGENAPGLAGAKGKPVVAKLRDIGKKAGYTFSILKTKSLLHGLSQVRNRTFYFFWKDSSTPIFDYINKPNERIEEQLRSVERRDDDPMSQILCNDNTPSEDPWYRYILEEVEGGITHKECVEKITKSIEMITYIEETTGFLPAKKWFESHGFTRHAEKCERMYNKRKAGFNIMKRATHLPKDYIGAFVGHYPTSLTHPDEDRYLTVREALSIMKLPEDFELLNPKKTLNHICQNVPVTTAEFSASMVKKYLDGHLDKVNYPYILQNNLNQTYEFPEDAREVVTLDAFLN